VDTQRSQRIKAIVPHVLYLLIISGIFFTLYIVVQQSYRMSANDPQIQIAEDVATALNAGGDPQSIASIAKIDMAKSITPFFIVYDQRGTAVAATAQLNNTTPALPTGVLDWVKQHGEDRITWQPQPGLRMAAVITNYNGGFVLAARPLREIEKRIDQLGLMVGLAWVAAMVLYDIAWAIKK
jgi:hypothetical protein